MFLRGSSGSSYALITFRHLTRIPLLLPGFSKSQNFETYLYERVRFPEIATLEFPRPSPFGSRLVVLRRALKPLVPLPTPLTISSLTQIEFTTNVV